ncbi:hypothetical protein A3733_20605 [Pseudoalteromonas shioyasakiensis]|nr:hypothetical protein A3733_20605 [Pseudoalteromonas shioyasakiensis]
MEAPTFELTRDNFNSIFFQTFIKTKVQPEIPIIRCAVPLPKAQKFKAKLITAVIFIIACHLVWKTQSGAGAIAAVVITYLSYFLIQMFIANKRYFIHESPLCEIKINKEEVYLPALLFDDRKARTLKREDLLNVEAVWNFTRTKSGYDINDPQPRRAYLFSVIFKTRYGDSIPLNDWSLEHPELFKTLVEYDYPVTMIRTAKRGSPITVHIKWFFLFTFICTLIYSLTKYVI